MNYLSLFSGIEAASVAWRPLGWQCVGVAEIDPFPCAVLAHHYPDVPNLGSVTDITDEQIAALGSIDVVVGGSPCQDLSVAGKRAGLAGERSGLFHEQLRIFHAARHLCGARFLVWENVPGAFSSHAGRDFAVVVGAMAGCRVDVPEDGWGTEGVALGEHGLVEWAVLDAQWFGVAQRRRRVFAVLDVGDWAGRPPILLESDRLRGDSAPSREAGEGVARPIAAGSARGSGYRDDADAADNLMPAPHDVISPALKARDSKGPSSDGDGDGAILVPMVAPTLRAGGNRTGGDRPPGTDVDTCESLIVAHTLRAEGFDASEDGTGRGTPLVPVVAGTMKACKESGGWSNSVDHAAAGYMVPVAVDVWNQSIDGDVAATLNAESGAPNHSGPKVMVPVVAPCLTSNYGKQPDSSDTSAGPMLVPVPFDTTQITSAENRSNPQAGDPCHPLAAGAHAPAIAFMADDYKDGGYEECDTARPLTTSADRTRAAPVVTTLAIRGRGDSHDLETRTDGTANALLTPNGGRGGIGVGAIHCGMQVRRLTPVECSRLQGFPDDYLLQVPWRGKTPPPDGPMYKALGNSMAVPVMRWIGQQIAAAASSRIAA